MSSCEGPDRYELSSFPEGSNDKLAPGTEEASLLAPVERLLDVNLVESKKELTDRTNSSDIKIDVMPNDFYCQICLTEQPMDVGYRLSCSHIYCRYCLLAYIRSKVTDAVISPCCFNTVDNIPLVLRRNHGDNIDCKEAIAPSDMTELMKEDVRLLEKYERFKYAKENKHCRECPFCSFLNVGTPDTTPRITCSECGKVYCYRHSNAHDFDLYSSCEEYDASISEQMKSSIELIDSFSKPCPRCGIPVLKTGKKLCW
jgi:hypothetical protein